MSPNTASDCVLSKRKKSVENDERINDRSDNAKSDVNKSAAKVRSAYILFVITLLASFCIFMITFLMIPLKKWITTEQEMNLNEYDQSAIEGSYYNFLATTEQHFSEISLHEVNCSEKGYARERAINAAPLRCGTLVYDQVVTKKEALRLRKIAAKLIDKIGDKSRFIRESLNLKWVNLHNAFRKGHQMKIFSEKDYELVRKTGETVKAIISHTFGLNEDLVFFSNVSQFTRHKPITQFSEFRHVDKVRSPSLIVTTILWLSTVDIDFIGGRLEFLTGGPEPFSPLLIEPKLGRFAAWTSSYENPHGVFELFGGERYALIFAFTASTAVGHPTIDHLREWAFSFDELNIV